MTKCKLCNVNDALQTGSHILSWFLIRDAINKNGQRRRHNEISFEISTASFVSAYFGSEILPEEIEKIKGIELTDDEIEQLENPYIRDNILCTNCEKRLATLENSVSENIFDKLRAYTVNQNHIYELLDISEKEYIRLFIYSLVWRSSITQFNGFRLDKSHEEVLRNMLNETLDINANQLQNNITVNSVKICSLPLAVSFLETKGENNNSIFCFHTRNPYSMIINDLVFQLFFKIKATKNKPDFIFGINQIVPRRKTLNLNESHFNIAIINDIHRLIIYRNLYSFIADKIMRASIANFKYAFENIFKRRAPPGIIEYFKFKVVNSTFDKVLLYSPEHFRNVSVDVMKEYFEVLRLYELRRQLYYSRMFNIY